jgi:hypothetical protein
VLFFRLPLLLLAVSSALLLWAVLTANLSDSIRASWPWKLELLDTQSATTATTIAAGLVFARAQYASVVRPLLGWTGGVVKVDEFSSEYAWMVRLVNGASTPSLVNVPEYRLSLKSGPGVDKPEEGPWVSREKAISALVSAGLLQGRDFELRYIGPAFPLSSSTQEAGVVGIFSRRAMEVVDDVLVRVEAADQAGDTHQRIIHCMRGAVRKPTASTVV